jgi:hypothetical protein
VLVGVAEIADDVHELKLKLTGDAHCATGPTRRSARMLETLKPTQEPGWVLSHEGYSISSESAVESRFALGTGSWGCVPLARLAGALPG